MGRFNFHPTVQAVRRVRADSIACGINNFTKCVEHGNGREITYAGTTGESVFEQLKDFKKQIKEVRPKNLVGFVTVPKLSIEKKKKHG